MTEKELVICVVKLIQLGTIMNIVSKEFITLDGKETVSINPKALEEWSQDLCAVANQLHEIIPDTKVTLE